MLLRRAPSDGEPYVATRNPALPTSWQNSEIIGPDPLATLERLKAGTGPALLTQGSSDFL